MTSNPTTRYRQRPNECDAIQWTGTNADALRAFAGADFDTIDPEDRIEDPDQDAQLLVEASHWVGIKPSDWVLKFEGYFVTKSDVPFRAVWEPAAASAVFPEPPSRAAVLLEAADRFARMPEASAPPLQKGITWAVSELRRLAAEAQQQEPTPCGPFSVCEDGGEPCANHEREQAHADGDHELCGPECTADRCTCDSEDHTHDGGCPAAPSS